ncbi:hypothetical protein [Pseudomonas saponiphila]|uniref:hypothetical protein n=1 Tax=Pseudomonas saponiphila TaxID=556534 RepID=UPI00224006FA|nr:hypothetical protein [Pseudomonas saponiphila]
MNIGNTRPGNYTYAQLSKVLELNRGIAQIKGSEVRDTSVVKQAFSTQLEHEQAAAKDEALKLKLSLNFSAEA